MYYDQKRRTDMLMRAGAVALLVSAMLAVPGCDAMRPFNKTILDGLGTVGKATVGGLNTAGRATVGSLQWVADGGEAGIQGQAHGATAKPFLLVTGLRFPGIKLSELSVLSMEAVDSKGSVLPWKQGALADTNNGPALTITVEPEATSQTVGVTGVLIYRGGRWTLSARCVSTGSGPGALWTTERFTVTRQ
jgi:hypothetical protein